MNTPDLATLKQAALEYRARGWSVLPLALDKTPTLRRWGAYKGSPASERAIAGWFGPKAVDGNVAGVGIILGAVSGGLAVRDYDDVGAYTQWQAAYPELAATLPTVRTARGFHVYFTAPGCKTRKFPDGELRGEGAYVVAPPSQHASGTVYKWLIPVPAEAIPNVDPSVFETEAVSIERGNGTEKWPECPVSLGCPEFLGTLVYDADLKARIERAISETVPLIVGARNAGIFAYARRLKAIPELASRKGLELREAVQWWHEAARPTIGTKDWDTTWADFLHGWARVRAPYGQAIAEALEQARIAPDPECAARFDAPQTRMLIRLCRVLQRRAGADPFFLTARAAGAAVSLDKGTALKRLEMLTAEGVLTRTYKGHTGKGSEYRYLGDDPA